MPTTSHPSVSRLIIVIAALVLLGTHSLLRAATFVVAPAGQDGNPGTEERPLATLHAACDATRRAGAGPHHIVLMPGEYYLARPLELDARDNGLTIEARSGGPVTLFGGRPVTGWRRDGEHLWYADLPGVKEGAWDFRAIVVNGRMPPRARFPASGTFLHRGTWNLPLLPAVGGYWERKPTPEELTTMPYDPQDIPATFDIRNAEVRLQHMWDESLLGIARHDAEHHAFIFSAPAIFPVGAFGIKKYVIFNTREGMTEPGQWYLDRTAGRLVYWPLPGEEMARAKVIAPTMERIIHIAGSAKTKAEQITIRGLSLQATTVPLKSAGFGGGVVLDGALSIAAARGIAIERLEIANVAGLGLLAARSAGGQIVDCHIHHIGACGMRSDGDDTLVARNHVHHVGVYYPSAAAMMIGGHTQRVCRNEIHDSPYSGIIGGGKEHLFEENLIYRVMREMQDGGGIYGNLVGCTLRGNIVRDVVQMGEGFGVSAYYLDEGARDCIVEHNVSQGVARPTHNHITHNVILRDNVFIADKDMVLSFQSSSGVTFERNTLFAPGRISVTQPNAVKHWSGNLLFRNGLGKNDVPQPFAVDDAMPPVATPGRRKEPAEVARVEQPPALNGDVDVVQWPGKLLSLNRDPSRQSACGAPVFVKLSYDERFLYVSATMNMFDKAAMSVGTTWGKDDGVELCIAGKAADGRPVTFVLRGYVGGAVQSVTDAGAPAADTARLGQQVRFVAKVLKSPAGAAKGWRAQWAIPFDALGATPAPGLNVPFNIGAYCSEFSEWHCWEGTLGENWRLDQAGTLLFR